MSEERENEVPLPENSSQNKSEFKHVGAVAANSELSVKIGL